MSIRDTLIATSTQARPPFALLQAAPRERLERAEPLGVAYRHPFEPVAEPDEQVLAHFIGLAGAHASLTREGRPGWGPDAQVLQITKGGAEVLVTDRRVVVMVGTGESILQPIDAGRGSVLAVVLPLAELEAITLTTKAGRFGAPKERHLLLHTAGGTGGVMIEALWKRRTAGRQEKYQGTLAEVQALIARAASGDRAVPEAVPQGNEQTIILRSQ